MFTSQASTGSGYTSPVAYLAVAFIFSPAVLVVSRPVGFITISVAIACSALCVALAWVNWRKFSRLSIAPAESQRVNKANFRP
jgi:hypothetical protein